MVSLAIDQQSKQNAEVITLNGYIDADTAPNLYSVLEKLRNNNQVNVVVDCANVHYLSSHGVWTLVKNIILNRESGGDIRLASVSKSMQEIFYALNMDTFFDYFESIDDAVKSFA